MRNLSICFDWPMYYAELINGLQPWNLGGAETPLSDPFLDLNLFLDSGVEAFPA